MPGRSTEEAGREEEEEKTRMKREESVMASVHEDVESTARRIVGQSVKQNLDCSQIENEEEEEEEDWQKEVQVKVQ